MNSVLTKNMVSETGMPAERGGKASGKGSREGMKTMRERIFLLLSAASFCSMFLPWFSFDVQVTGVQWGYYFFLPMVIPFILIIACYSVFDSQNSLRVILMELSLISVPLLLVYELINWHVAFITGEPSLRTGLRTALPTFWIAMGLSLAAFLAYQLCLPRKRS